MNFKRPLVGMDIGDSSIKVSVVSKKGNKFYLEYASLLPLSKNGDCSSDAGKIMGLKAAFKNSRLKKDPVVMNYVGKAPFIRYLKFPVMPEHELAQAVGWEAKKLLTEPPEAKVVDYAVLQKKVEGDQTVLEVILVAVDKSDLSEGLGIVWKAGIFPRLMDVNPLALLKVIEVNHSEEIERELVFIDIGSAKMDMNISREGVLRFTRQIDLGGDDITRAIMGKKSVSFDEAESIKKEEGLAGPENEEAIKGGLDRMVLEVQRSIDYYRAQFRDSIIRKMILMGGTPLMRGFRDYFENHFDFPVVLENPFSTLTGPPALLKELNPVGSIWASSIGLALRGKVPGHFS